MRKIETQHPNTELRVRFTRHRRTRDLTCARGRRLVLVDIENVVGGPCNTPDRTRWAHRRLRDAVGLGSTDHIVVGVDASGLESVCWDWPRVRYVAGYGEDGADRALLDVLAEDVADRYEHVVLASGDGIFAEMVAALTAAGVRVTVVAHEVALSASLRLAASDVVLLSRIGASGVPASRSA
ncbi:MAG TPA: NYN domain-containing protein [Marmoricola sp.]|nr:NYN domain-containing protein [Marmoricola sp.]